MIRILSGNDASEYIVAGSPCHLVSWSETVREIIRDVKLRGDAALQEFAERFGDAPPARFEMDSREVAEAMGDIPEDSRKLLERAAGNIRVFAEEVMRSIKPVELDRGTYKVGLDFRPVRRAGCYVPGGRYPLPSSALMTAITAKVAGVAEVSVASPVMCKEVLYACKLAGVDLFYRIGGAQAIAALAFGTGMVRPVDIIVGPGNAYVTEAKRQLQGVVGIDMLAGPSEVAIIADAGADPKRLALDMLAQAEHDPGARAWLLTDDRDIAERVADEIETATSSLGLPEFIEQSLQASAILVFSDMDECAAASDMLAPEHLQLQVKNPAALKAGLTAYGALFMGYEAAVPFGDYMAGPNHTLPTGRTARFAGGLSPLAFLRPQSWLTVEDAVSKSLAADTAAFADMEGLKAHAAAARARIRIIRGSLGGRPPFVEDDE